MPVATRAFPDCCRHLRPPPTPTPTPAPHHSYTITTHMYVCMAATCLCSFRTVRLLSNYSSGYRLSNATHRPALASPAKLSRALRSQMNICEYVWLCVGLYLFPVATLAALPLHLLRFCWQHTQH